MADRGAGGVAGGDGGGGGHHEEEGRRGERAQAQAAAGARPARGHRLQVRRRARGGAPVLPGPEGGETGEQPDPVEGGLGAG